MIRYIFTAIALVLVLEGIMPFVCPDCWRRSISKVTQFDNKILRTIGLISMLIGVVILFVLHHEYLF